MITILLERTKRTHPNERRVQVSRVGAGGVVDEHLEARNPRVCRRGAPVFGHVAERKRGAHHAARLHHKRTCNAHICSVRFTIFIIISLIIPNCTKYECVLCTVR